MSIEYTKHPGYAFSRAFARAPLDELKLRFSNGEPLHHYAYCSIPHRPKAGLDDELEVYKWLLSTNFDQPTGDFWLFVAGMPNSVDYAKATLAVYPKYSIELIMIHALDHFDQPLVEFAAKHIELNKGHILYVEDHTPAGTARNSFRAWLLKKTNNTEGSYLRWKLARSL